jgi:hypothetical protein
MGIDNTDRDHEVEDDMNALEHRLAAWRPAAGALDRDRMLYEAGSAAARAEARVRPWRLATAALAVVALGLFGLLVHHRSLLAHERSLLAQERSRPRVRGTVLAAGTEASGPSHSAPGAPAPALEPLPPTSYFAMASRLSKGIEDPSPPDFQSQPASRGPAPGPVEAIPRPGPLQLRDVQRVLDL